ncbi:MULTISPECIES: TetR/AcrR family transcriptional regulator [unclassified Streptomyces]|uniref:TetR/AcrR family transcriptional regulator n=1 Tax=unclassified Streptomyces TaxID=2593676 RepID=UPI00037C3572|nr:MULTISPECIES: TetR/AcrR family transcriptional regulator [unclassified Streptomyces]MYY05551.1 TetR family transcriptional regulator [Streptomyces sp. SID4913]
MSAIRGARERARIEVTAAIKDEARKQLAAEGAAKLSLRAVARELGMVSSALYRYFPSRDDLLTALIVDAYDAIGEAAERAHRTTAGTTDTPASPGTGLARWVAVARAVRDWALAHPHEYALIYGSPVPGYTAPQDTIAPAARVGLVLIAVVEEAHRAEGLALPPLADELRPEAERLAAELTADLTPDLTSGLAPAVAAPLVAAWAQLFGLISFEVFGQFNRVVEAREVFFRHAVTELARTVGLLGRRG